MEFDNKLRQLTEEANDLGQGSLKNLILSCKTELQKVYSNYVIYQKNIEKYSEYINPILNEIRNTKISLEEKIHNSEHSEKLKNDIYLNTNLSLLSATQWKGNRSKLRIKYTKYSIDNLLINQIINLDNITFSNKIFKSILIEIGDKLVGIVSPMSSSDLKLIAITSMNNFMKNRNVIANEQNNYYEELNKNLTSMNSFIIEKSNNILSYKHSYDKLIKDLFK